jgi:hypothetical protein
VSGASHAELRAGAHEAGKLARLGGRQHERDDESRADYHSQEEIGSDHGTQGHERASRSRLGPAADHACPFRRRHRMAAVD